MTRVFYADDPDQYRDGIKTRLVAAQDEFVPPLGNRDGTTQTDGLDDADNSGIDDYYDQLMDQSFVLAVDETDGVVGFLSFRNGYETAELGDYTPSNYVSTIAVADAYRRQGIARRMYEVLFTEIPAALREQYVTTRTWHTNEKHLRLLSAFGFETVTRIENDRGDGIDTVYLGYDVTDFDGT